MNISEVDYKKLKLLSVETSPSRYLFSPEHMGKLLSWQICMADNSVRDVLFSDLLDCNDMTGTGSNVIFNIQSGLPTAMAADLSISPEQLKYKSSGSFVEEISFVPENIENISFYPKVSYKLSELSVRVEVSIANRGKVTLHWRPEIHFFVNLPWADEISLEQHILKSFAKKRLRMSDDWNVINSVKSSEKTFLEILNDGPLGFSNLQDSKIWIGTSNEEEGLSFIFGKRSANSVFSLKKVGTSKVLEVVFFSGIKGDKEKKFTNWEQLNLIAIPPSHSDTFAAEISVY